MINATVNSEGTNMDLVMNKMFHAVTLLCSHERSDRESWYTGLLHIIRSFRLCSKGTIREDINLRQVTRKMAEDPTQLETVQVRFDDTAADHGEGDRDDQGIIWSNRVTNMMSHIKGLVRNFTAINAQVPVSDSLRPTFCSPDEPDLVNQDPFTFRIRHKAPPATIEQLPHRKRRSQTDPTRSSNAAPYTHDHRSTRPSGGHHTPRAHTQRNTEYQKEYRARSPTRGRSTERKDRS